MKDWTKDEFARRSAAHLKAFAKLAEKLEPSHPARELLGGLAHGRHEAERGPSQQTVRHYVAEFSYLKGCALMFIRWCNLTNNQTLAGKFNDFLHAALAPRITPADPKRCQAEVLSGSFMTLGPRRMERCTNVPTVMVREKRPDRHGDRGEMSLCPSCLKVFRTTPDYARVSEFVLPKKKEDQ